MKKYFIYKDEKSQKFWNIEKIIDGILIHYGRIGTTGQLKDKKIETEIEKDKEISKLISQKIKKGYIEVTDIESSSAKDEAKRYSLTESEVYDDGKGIEDLIKKIEKDKKIEKYKHITIGSWGDEYDESCQSILDYISNNAEKFENLETLFIGDIDSDICEISWITQGNYTEILKKLKNLKNLKIKGSNELVLSEINHENLEHLEIICGGLPKKIINNIVNSNLPSLQTLILYMGVEDYGFDGDISNIKMILKENLFPNLKKLELVNSEIQDNIVKEIIESNILSQLEILSFSYGTLTDVGGKIILNNSEKLENLKEIIIEHHYLSEKMEKELKEKLSNIKISKSDHEYEYEDGDEIMRYPMITE